MAWSLPGTTNYLNNGPLEQLIINNELQNTESSNLRKTNITQPVIIWRYNFQVGGQACWSDVSVSEISDF